MLYTKEMVFQQNLLKKSYFVSKMSGPAGQFLLLESALRISKYTENIRMFVGVQIFAFYYNSFVYIEFENYLFFLFQVPPRFTIVPRDAEAPSGSSPMFSCQASGDPVPTIRWSKTGSSKSPTQQLKNGSLLIRNIQKANEGRYSCLASNSLKIIKREFTLTVYSKFDFFCWDS